MPIRKRGRMPGSSAEFYSYDLEYGSATIEMSTADLPEHSKVMLHDDLLATGSTAAAAAKLIRDAGSEIVMFAFIGHLEYLEGDEKLLSYSHNIFTLAQV
jgi:adenine phosphoribosyltransferase